MLLYLYFLTGNVGKTILSISLVLLFTSMLLTYNSSYGAILTPEDNEAKEKIVTELSNKVDHKYDRYDLIIASVKGDNSTFVIINQTGEFPIPPIICGEGTVEENGVCVPEDPEPPGQQCDEGEIWNATSGKCEQPTEPEPEPPVEPEPEPPADSEKTTIGTMGDIEGYTVFNAMASKDYDINVANGDLGYKSSLTEFKGKWNSLSGEKACVIGNHDSEEDGSSQITTQAREYCGDVWTKVVANGTTMLLGANTNGNLGSIGVTLANAVQNEAAMEGVNNVVLFTHKPCATFPNSHHGVEGNVKKFCDTLKSKIPEGVGFVTIAGHNHENAKKQDESAFIAGGGGGGARDCGTGSGWDFCSKSEGWLELTIDNNSGDIDYKFIKTNGGAM